MFLRVLVIVFVLNPAMGPALVLPMAVMAAVCFAGAGILWLEKSPVDMDCPAILPNPFELGVAIKFGLFIGLILLLSHLFQQWFGNHGFYVLAAFSGLADVDAITVAAARLATQTPAMAEAATAGVVIASAVNTAVKGGIAFVLCGGPMAWRAAAVLGLSLVAGGAAFFLG